MGLEEFYRWLAYDVREPVIFWGFVILICIVSYCCVVGVIGGISQGTKEDEIRDRHPERFL